MACHLGWYLFLSEMCPCFRNPSTSGSRSITMLVTGTNGTKNSTFVHSLTNFIQRRASSESPASFPKPEEVIEVPLAAQMGEVPMEPRPSTSNAVAEAEEFTFSAGSYQPRPLRLFFDSFRTATVNVAGISVELISSPSVSPEDVLDLLVELQHRKQIDFICIVLDEKEQPWVTADFIQGFYAFISTNQIQNILGVYLENSAKVRRSVQQTRRKLEKRGFQFPTFFFTNTEPAQSICFRLARHKQLSHIWHHIFTLKPLGRKPFVLAQATFLVKLLNTRVQSLQAEIQNLWKERDRVDAAVSESSDAVEAKRRTRRDINNTMEAYRNEIVALKRHLNEIVRYIRQNVISTHLLRGIMANIGLEFTAHPITDDQLKTAVSKLLRDAPKFLLPEVNLFANQIFGEIEMPA